MASELQPKDYNSELSKTLTKAYDAVWATLYAHMPDENSDEASGVRIELSRTLAGLAASGVTDFQDLRRKALVAIALSGAR